MLLGRSRIIPTINAGPIIRAVIFGLLFALQTLKAYSFRINNKLTCGMAALSSTTNGARKEDLNVRHLHGYGNPNHTSSILQKITAQRFKDVELARSEVSAAALESQIAAFDDEHGGPLNLLERIRTEEGVMALAAEFKRASPSKGDIAPDLIASEQAVKYAGAGAAILSVLTEPKWFKGTLNDMRDVRIATEKRFLPRPAVLRKDFVVEEYQILEARAYGADTVLLIVAILEVDRLHALIKCSRQWDMEPLVEVNTLQEMEIALDAGAKVIGVNNRNLHTFQLDLGTTVRVMDAARKRGLSWAPKNGDIALAALSGISSRADVVRYEKVGVAVVLIGETLMRAPDPTKAVRELLGLEDISGWRGGSGVLVKVCGIAQVEDALAATQASANLIGTIFCKSKRQVNAAQSKQIVEAVRGFGERIGRVLAYKEEIEGGASYPSSAWFDYWRNELLRVTKRTPLVIGVFQNTPMEEVVETVEAAGVDLIQLHGEEDATFANQVSKKTGVPCIKVLHVPHEGAEMSEVLAGLGGGEGGETGGAIAILLDTSVGGQKGGSGQQFDWSLASTAQEKGYPVIVAGGLLASNVEEALKTAQPFGVDVSGGVEASPGIKDHAKITDFIGRVRALK